MHGLAAMATANLAEPGPEVGARSERFVVLVFEALRMVDAHVVPTYPPRHLPILRLRHERARAHVAIAAGDTHKFLLQYEEALMLWREAALIADAIPAPNTAAMVRTSAGALRLVELGQPEAVDEELGDGIDGDTLGPVARRTTLTISAAAAAARGEPTVAAARLREAWRLKVTDRHHVAVIREVEGAAFSRPPRSVVRAHRELVDRMHRLYSATVDPAFGAPTVDSNLMESPAGRLALRGHTLWLEGRTAKAEALLTVAAKSAAATGDHIWLFRIHWDLGRIHLLEHRQLLSGYVHMARAMEALDEVRVRTLDPDLRIGVGGQGGEVYELAVAALYAASKRPGPHPEPLDRPLCSALEVAERMRSRVFLELLAAPDVDDPPDRDARSARLRQSAPATYEEIRQLLTAAD